MNWRERGKQKDKRVRSKKGEQGQYNVKCEQVVVTDLTISHRFLVCMFCKASRCSGSASGMVVWSAEDDDRDDKFEGYPTKSTGSSLTITIILKTFGRRQGYS